MFPLSFTSLLNRSYQDELEQVLFMNGNQKKVRECAQLAIERYGTPRISALNNRLWVTFDSGIEAQSLFLVEKRPEKEQLVGVIVYTRNHDALDVLFVAVLEKYAYGETEKKEVLFFRILAELKSIARRIKGIKTIRLYLKKPPIVLSTYAEGSRLQSRNFRQANPTADE
jgi:hypothetical protein